MSKYAIDLKKELEKLKFQNNLYQKIDCSLKDNKKYKDMLKNKQQLPTNIFQNTAAGEQDTFYSIYKNNLNYEELQEYIQLKKLSYLKTIKKCCIFFVTLTIISIIITLFLFGDIQSLLGKGIY